MWCPPGHLIIKHTKEPCPHSYICTTSLEWTSSYSGSISSSSATSQSLGRVFCPCAMRSCVGQSLSHNIVMFCSSLLVMKMAAASQTLTILHACRSLIRVRPYRDCDAKSTVNSYRPIRPLRMASMPAMTHDQSLTQRKWFLTRSTCSEEAPGGSLYMSIRSLSTGEISNITVWENLGMSECRYGNRGLICVVTVEFGLPHTFKPVHGFPSDLG